MKKSLKNLFSSLAFRVLFALAAIGSTAKAHDLPYCCPFAHDAWSHLNPSCLGNQDLHDSVSTPDPATMDAPSTDDTVYFALAPDEGESPSPDSTSTVVTDAAADSVPFCYDGVDCSKLEDYYRTSIVTNAETNLDAGWDYPEDVYTENETTVGSHQDFVDVAKLAWPSSVKPFRLDSSCENAGPCDFESGVSDAEARTPLFMFRRHCVEDVSSERFSPIVWRQYAGQGVYENSSEELAIATPIVPQLNREMVSTALDRLAQWDCQLNAEFWDWQSAYLLGRQIGSFTNYMQNNTVSRLGDMLAKWSDGLPKSNAAELPIYVLYQTSGGDPMFVPMPIARDWQILPASEDLIDPNRDDEAAQRFAEVVNVVNARLKWAGGRMSIAINYIQDWVADRVAQTPTSDMR